VECLSENVAVVVVPKINFLFIFNHNFYLTGIFISAPSTKAQSIKKIFVETIWNYHWLGNNIRNYSPFFGWLKLQFFPHEWTSEFDVFVLRLWTITWTFYSTKVYVGPITFFSSHQSSFVWIFYCRNSIKRAAMPLRRLVRILKKYFLSNLFWKFMQPHRSLCRTWSKAGRQQRNTKKNRFNIPISFFF